MKSKSFGFGKSYFNGSEDHPNPSSIGYWDDGWRNGPGLLFHRNGNIMFTGRFTNNLPDKNQFYREFSQNGAINTDETNGEE
jgi:antitoxin component YwqK of YwqJK toxin-antitoxin module